MKKLVLLFFIAGGSAYAQCSSVGGAVSSDMTVCSGMNSSTLNLNGYTGSVLRWESSIDNFNTDITPITNTTTSQAFSNITSTTQFRAVVQDGGCPSENSSSATITVDPIATGGIVTSDAIVCVGSNSGILSLSGHTGIITHWQVSTDNFATSIVIANTTMTQYYLNLTQSTQYRAVVKSGVCSSVNSSVAYITVNPLMCGTVFKIRGKVFEDKNENGIQDGGESGLQNVRVSSYAPYVADVTDSSGNYETYAFDTGYVKVNVQLPHYSQQTFPANDDSIYVSKVNDSISGKDFGVHFLTDIYDVETRVSSALARPGFLTYAYVTVRNAGTEKLKNIHCELDYDGKLIVASVSQAYTAGASSILFSVDSLNVGEEVVVTIAFNVPAGAGNIGYDLSYYSRATITIDYNTFNNFGDTHRTISGSYDPNLKESTLGEGGIHYTTKEMDYTIHFQNTGNDTAFTVVVVDSLNRKVFDHTSVEMLSSSHRYSYTIDTAGVIKFTFPNILLVDSMTNEPKSHGFVRFKLNLKNGLNLGTVIKNKAEIYFDFNEAIVTNTATNTLVDKTGINDLEDYSMPLSLYPNPTTGNVTLKFSAMETGSVNISIYDILGQKTLSQNVKLSEGENQIQLSTNELSNGVYIVQVSNGSMNSVISLVVQK